MSKTIRSILLATILLFAFTLTAAAQIAPADFQSPQVLRVELAERAKKSSVSAVGVTVFNEDGEVYSVYHGDGVSSASLFQAASMSKSVTALAVLALAHKHEIDLDEDMRPYVKSLDWGTIKGGHQPISLRQLLSHTAGASVSGFPGYRRSSTLPVSVDIVTGGPRTNTPTVRLREKKGRFSYSGGGYQILQLFVEDQTGLSFEGALQLFVLKPLDMTSSTFTQPITLSDIKPLKIAAAEHPFNPAKGIFWPINKTWRDYPEQAAAGLWTTSADYSKFGSALQRAQSGRDLLGIPNENLNELFDEVDADYGLGLILHNSSSGRLLHFGHSGANFGYRCIFRSFPDKKEGIVVMTNSPNGVPLMKELVAAFAAR